MIAACNMIELVTEVIVHSEPVRHSVDEENGKGKDDEPSLFPESVGDSS
jgi:hypothetical protein